MVNGCGCVALLVLLPSSASVCRLMHGSYHQPCDQSFTLQVIREFCVLLRQPCPWPAASSTPARLNPSQRGCVLGTWPNPAMAPAMAPAVSSEIATSDLVGQLVPLDLC
jgi:hypothetical protein